MTISRLLLTALVGWAALAGPAGAQDSDELERLLAQAVDMHQAGDLLGAVNTYRVVLQTDPERADVRSNLGAAYVQLGRFEDGIREYREAIRLDPRNSTYSLNLGLALYKANELEEAVPAFRQVVALDPGNFKAVLLLADCYLNLGQDAEVIALLSPLDAVFRDNLAYAYILGHARLRSGDQEGGQVLIDRIFKAGESAEGHLLMGLAYMNGKDYRSAVTELARAVELNPDLPRARAVYARALLSSGDQESAGREFQRALQLDPNDFEANLQLGGIRQRQQRYDEALMYLDRAAAVRPDDLAVHHAKASVYLGMGEPERALGLLEQVVKEAPDFVDAHVLLATTYYRLKRKEDGDRERAIVLKLNAERQARQPGARQASEPVPPPDKTGSNR